MSAKSFQGEIMVVEDNPSDRSYLSEILTTAGYRVRPAGDGELALRSLRAKLPDLLLLDLKLPGMSGVELCRLLKADPATTEVPVIFISAVGKTDLKVKALEAGAVDYVTKPFATAELLARVSTHLKVHRLRRSLQVQSELLAAQIQERKLVEAELSQMVRFVSHDLRAPLVNIAGFSVELGHSLRALLEILDQVEVDPELEAKINELGSEVPVCLDFITRSVAKMQGLVHAVAALARVGRTPPSIVRLDMNALIENMLACEDHHLKTMGGSAERKNLPPCRGDAVMVGQVFSNLLSNGH